MSFFGSIFKGVTSGFQSLFDAGKFKVEVKIDQPNYLNMHIAGGAVTGICVITCTANATIRGFTLTHAVRSSFIPKPSQAVSISSETFAACCHDAHARIRKSKPLFKQEFVLFGSRSGSEISVPPGTYTYPFQIAIPEWIAGSFSAGVVSKFNMCCDCCCESCGLFYILGGVVHSIDVQVIIANSLLDHNFDREIDVQRAAPNEALSIPRPISSTMNVSARGCCCGGGCCARDARVELRIVLPRADWIIGLDSNIIGLYSGQASCDFDLCLLSTTTFSSRMCRKLGLGPEEDVAQTKLVRTSFKQGKKGYYSADQGVEFSIPIPRDLPASCGAGNADTMFGASIQYSLVAVPRNICCAWDFEDPSMPIVLNLSRALAAPRIAPVLQQFQQPLYQQQHLPSSPYLPPPQHQVMPPQSNFAATGEIPSFEQCFAYRVPPANAAASFHPAYEVTELNLPPAVWGTPVQVSNAIPTSAYQIPLPGNAAYAEPSPSTR